MGIDEKIEFAIKARDETKAATKSAEKNLDRLMKKAMRQAKRQIMASKSTARQAAAESRRTTVIADRAARAKDKAWNTTVREARAVHNQQMKMKNAADRIALLMQKRQEETDKAHGMGLNVPNFRKGLNRANLEWQGGDQFYDPKTKAMIKEEDATKRITRANKRFKMELLSVMFLGMAMTSVYKNMTQGALQATGALDIWSSMLTVIFLPFGMFMTSMALKIWKFIDTFPFLKTALNIIVPIIGLVGGFLALYGAIGLGIQGLSLASVGWAGLGTTLLAFGKNLLKVGPWLWAGVTELWAFAVAGWAAVAPFLPFIAIAALVALAIALIVKNWSTMTSGFAIMGRALLSPIKYFNMLVDAIKEMGGWLEALKLLFSPIAELFGAKAYVPKGWAANGVTPEMMTPAKQAKDFIWRAGQAPMQISPSDNITGAMAGSGAVAGIGGGMNLSPTINFNNPVITNTNAREFAKQVLDILYIDLRRMGLR